MAIESRVQSLVDASWSEFGVTTVLVSLRLYTTFILLPESPGFLAKAATYCATLAWSIGLINSIFVQLAANNGMGRHLANVPLSTLPAALKYAWSANAASRLSIAAGKVAVVLFIAAIQRGVLKPWQRMLLGFIAISNVCINIAVVFTLFFQCSPPSKLWDMSVSGHCDLKEANGIYGFFTTAWGAASDLTLALYPTYLFWYLQMERRLKITMSILFGLGIFAAACASVTCYQLHLVTNTSDPTWILVPLMQWGYSEMWVVIMAACVPSTLPSLRRRFSSTRTAIRSIYSPANARKCSEELGTEFPDHELLRIEVGLFPKESIEQQDSVMTQGKKPQHDLNSLEQGEKNEKTIFTHRLD